MKKLITMLLALCLMLPCTTSFADNDLSENEQKFVGAWNMYAEGSNNKEYVFMIVFTDNMQVVQRSMIFKDGMLSSDNKASGVWGGFADKTVIFTLAGTDMTAMIKDDGYLYMYFFKDLSLCGIFSKCPDMTEAMGW